MLHRLTDGVFYIQPSPYVKNSIRVKCVGGCGNIIERATQHASIARCHECRKERQRLYAKEYLAKQQALGIKPKRRQLTKKEVLAEKNQWWRKKKIVPKLHGAKDMV